jgi:hypothetical protein
MVSSRATTVKQYLADLPAERRAVVQAVRKVILDNLSKGYEEGMSYGMLGYYIPHELYPPGYHADPKQPLGVAALAAQKNYYSLYLALYYGDGEHMAWFLSEWDKTGKKLDMGKSCIRFKKLDDLPLELIGRAIARFPVKRYIELYESTLTASQRNKRPRKSGAG